VRAPAPGLEVREIDGLYRAHAGRLHLIVRRDVHEVHDAVIEDACQFAWSRLVSQAARIRRETALNWLARTAVNEALKLVARQRREVSLELTESAEAPEMAQLGPGPDDVAEARDRLALTAGLPARQQRILWLHALGLSYTEIARRTGCTTRTVERQLLRARSTMQARIAA
jgi:RNA polymerase sigma factor (sigma-70 family)